ncbi:acyl-CoA dehydrogenase family protein [Umezawaea sp. Da 62-37]|uniref:acyl-CoA dehydrogenase family protein n=1 Tax=Umezawaea sp. Da 62-37 TaxID=3075927 RepID=UPI0028F747B4|nr:acyl-CoA dehydrogenase family protein [Umezawaea sp. Da 62-37]WNV88248.1 acyl-CoA dehydrogenase family protein [Umezawaea sp. Da 62-37]
MTDELQLLDETVRAIFAKHFDRDTRAATGREFPRELWTVLDKSGLTALGDVESGAGLAELVVLARAVGRAGAPVPLVESAGLAAWLVTGAGLDLPPGLTTCAAAHPDDDLTVVRAGDGWTATGVLHRVPWGRDSDQVAAVATGEGTTFAVVLPIPDDLRRGTNLADEPRDTVRFDGVALAADAVAPTAVDQDALRERGAVLRAASMGGAMEAALELSLAYAGEREQFGQPISSFQAVQHHLVAIAEETMCTGMAVQLAVSASPEQTSFAVAAAKNTAGCAARIVTKRAHQVHGAIGVTDEHALPWSTTRLWAWQDEFGTTRDWAALLGRGVLADGGAGLWPRLSASAGTGEAG